MAIQYDSANNQVVFSGDAYVKREAAGAIRLGNASTGLVASDHALFAAISTPTTPGSGLGRLFAGGAGASDVYWLNSSGVAVSLTQSQTFSTLQGEPTGLPNRTDSTLSFNNTTREFTIAPAVTSFDVYSKGTKYTKSSAQTVTLTDVTGLHYVYFDASGVLQKATSAWDLSAGISPVATVYWNTDLDQGRIGEERHGLVMDWATHDYMHETLGSRYVNGLGGSFTNTTFTITDGVYRDEDIRHVPGEQTQCRVFRRDGSGNWTWGSKGTLYYVVQNTHLTYDNGGTLTETNSNDYVAVWFFVTNDPETPIYVIMGQRKDGNIADARNNNTYDQLSLTNLPAKEFKVLYRVLLRDDASPYEEAQDLRSLAVVSSGTYVATDHNSLTNRTVLGSHPASAITVDVGAFTGFLTGTTSAQTAFATLDTHTHAPPTGDTKVIYNDGGAWAAADVYYTKGNGYLGVGQATPGERLHLKDGSGNGAVVLGAHQNGTAIAGTVEWTGSALRWYDGSTWKSAGIELTDPLLYKGAIDCSGNPNYPAADAGFTYRISVAGKIGGASGPNVEAGDMLVCHVDGSAAGTHAVVGANWDILQINLDGAVIGPTSATDSAVALFDSTTGKLIKNSLVTIDGSGSVNIPSGQSYKINGTALTAANVGAEPTLPLSTRGDLLYRNASNVTARFPVGTNEQVITTNGTDVSWGAVPGRHDAVTLATSATTGGLGLSTQEISFQAASGSTNGYLTSTNWTTFNSKVSGAAGSNTEIQYNSSGAFAASSNLVWDNGNVRLGIGGAPQATLDVQAASAWIRAMGSTDPYVSAQDTTNSCVVKIQALDTAVSVGAQSDHEVRFIVNNAAKMYLTTTGRLGINVAAPSYILHTSVDGRGDVQFDSHSASDDGVFLWLRRSGGTQASPAAVSSGHRLGNIVFAGYYDTSNSSWGAVIQSMAYGLWSATNRGACLQFYTTTTGTTALTERMRIIDNGYVGIGATTPDAKLQVNTWVESNVVGNTPTVLVWGNVGMSDTSETVLRLQRPVASGTSYNGGVDFNIHRYNTSGISPYTQMDIALKSVNSYTQTATVNVISLRDTGAVGIGNVAPDTLLTLGTAGTTAGVIKIAGLTSGTCTVRVAAVAGSGTIFELPATNGTNGYFLKTDGTGVTSWAAAGGGSPGGSDTYVQYNNSSAFGGMDTFRWDGSTFKLILGKVGQAAKLQLAGSTSGTVDIAAPATVTSYTLTLPANDGDNGQFLKTNGSGTCTWGWQSYNADGVSTGAETTDTTCFPVFVTTNTGYNAAKVNPYLLYNSSTGLLTLGASGSTKTGMLGLAGATSGLVTVTTVAAAGTWTMTLPTTGGTNGYFLKTNGSGTCTWAAAGASPNGSYGYVQLYNDAISFFSHLGFRWENTNKRLAVGYTSLTPQATLHVQSETNDPVMGSELVTNGSFTGSATGWTLGTGWAYGTNNVICTLSGSVEGSLYQAITVTNGRRYQITWRQTNSATLNGGVRISLGGNTTVATGFMNITTSSILWTVHLLSTVTGSSNLVFEVIDRLSSGTITIDDVSVMEITEGRATARFDTADGGGIQFRSNALTNFGIGDNVMNNLSGSTQENCGFGYYTLGELSTGNGNTAIGSSAMARATRLTSSVAIGSQSMRNQVVGSYNVACGAYAMSSSVNCDAFVAIGHQSAHNMLSGSNGVAVGQAALMSQQYGDQNTSIGAMSLYNLTTGSQNIAIGYRTGRYYGSGTSSLTTATASIFIGSLSRASADGNTNEIVIGANAIGNGSNTATIGHTDVTKIYLRGDIYSNTAYAKAVGGTNRAAYVDSTGLIGTISSSLRTKQDVVDMEDVGWIDRLHPVNFCYRSTPGVKQYGLIAEEVEGVNRDIVGYDWEGLPDSVNYDRLVPVLLKAVKDLRGEVQRLRAELLP